MTQKPHTPPSSPAPGGKAPSTKAVDWERIELDYRAGAMSLREIAANHPGTNHVAIARRAKTEGWTRDLSERIKAKAEDLVTRAAVTADVTANRAVTEKQVVEANAQAQAQVGPENAALLAGLGEVMRSPDENGQDKLNDLYRKIISLPERAKTAKTLAETLRIAVDMERQAFGMDAKGADGATPGAAGYVPPSIRVVHVTAPVRQEDDDAGD